MIEEPITNLDPPSWLSPILTALLGGAGVHYFRVWIENRRLAKKEYRDVLLDRIRDLEGKTSRMHQRMEDMRAEVATLEAENKELRRRLGIQHADEQADRGDDHGLVG